MGATDCFLVTQPSAQGISSSSLISSLGSYYICFAIKKKIIASFPSAAHHPRHAPRLFCLLIPAATGTWREREREKERGVLAQQRCALVLASSGLWDQLDPYCTVMACPCNLLLISLTRKIIFFTHPIAKLNKDALVQSSYYRFLSNLFTVYK